MKAFKHVKTFKFGFAQYFLADENGTNVTLEVNYENNAYDLKSGRILSENFREEVDKFAQDLLQRKHGIDFAKKVR